VKEQTHDGTPPPGSIVVGIDGSGVASQALVWAAEEAVLRGRTLLIVHAVAPLDADIEASLRRACVDPQDVLKSMWTQSEELLDRVQRRALRLAPEVAVQTLLRDGDPRAVLLELSTAAAVVVVGSHGRGPLRSLLLGSVSAALAREATCPVVVVRPQRPGVVRRGVVVGTDGSAASRTAVEFAYLEASVRRLPLTVLSCLSDARDEDAPVGVVAEDAPGLDWARADLAASVAGLGEKYPDVRVRLQLATGHVDELLIEVADHRDLVVVGARRATSRAHGPLSLVRRVVEHAPCPVAVIPGTD
jgi:nucleotide-binding universal stress UspA family protein